MMMINWHYSRADLAARYMDAFATGITGAISIFAPRRMGKTQFVLRDLAIEAEDRGYRVGYCSFWNLEDNPAKALNMALEEIETTSWKKRWNDYLNSATSEVSASMAGASFKVKTEAQKVEEDDLVEIINKLRRLAKGRKKVLLICDEVQHLANNQYSSLVATLRTQFDQHQNKIHVVFTGSSRDGLQRLFRDRRTPMFHAAQQVDFPNLDSGFVKFMLEAFKEATKRSLNLSEAVRIFKKLDYNPALFHHLLRHMVIGGIWDIEEGFSHFHSLLDQEADYSMTFSQCKAIDQAVLAQLAKSDATALYSNDVRTEIANDVGVENVSTKSVQHALNRLRSDQLIFNIEHGRWIIEDPAFAKWIRNKKKDTP